MHKVDAFRSFAMLRMTIFDRVFGMTNTTKQKKHPRLSQGRGATLVNFKNRALTHDYENIPISIICKDFYIHNEALNSLRHRS